MGLLRRLRAGLSVGGLALACMAGFLGSCGTPAHSHREASGAATAGQDNAPPPQRVLASPVELAEQRVLNQILRSSDARELNRLTTDTETLARKWMGPRSNLQVLVDSVADYYTLLADPLTSQRRVSQQTGAGTLATRWRGYLQVETQLYFYESRQGETDSLSLSHFTLHALALGGKEYLDAVIQREHLHPVAAYLLELVDSRPGDAAADASTFLKECPSSFPGLGELALLAAVDGAGVEAKDLLDPALDDLIIDRADHISRLLIGLRRSKSSTDLANFTAFGSKPLAAALWLRFRTDHVSREDRAACHSLLYPTSQLPPDKDEHLACLRWAITRSIELRWIKAPVPSPNRLNALGADPYLWPKLLAAVLMGVIDNPYTAVTGSVQERNLGVPVFFDPSTWDLLDLAPSASDDEVVRLYAVSWICFAYSTQFDSTLGLSSGSDESYKALDLLEGGIDYWHEAADSARMQAVLLQAKLSDTGPDSALERALIEMISPSPDADRLELARLELQQAVSDGKWSPTASQVLRLVAGIIRSRTDFVQGLGLWRETLFGKGSTTELAQTYDLLAIILLRR